MRGNIFSLQKAGLLFNVTLRKRYSTIIMNWSSVIKEGVEGLSLRKFNQLESNPADRLSWRPSGYVSTCALDS